MAKKKTKSTNLLVAKPTEPKSATLLPAYWLLHYGIESVNHLYVLYDGFTKGKVGAPESNKQDLLRAMLVMAGATVDSVIKRAVIDSVPILINNNHASKKEITTLVQKKLFSQVKEDNKEGMVVAEALLSASPQEKIIEFIVYDMTKGSLQSKEGIERITAALAIKEKIKIDGIKPAFDARNEIIHELDCISPTENVVGKRIRRIRQKQKMATWSKSLLDISISIIAVLDKEMSDKVTPQEV